MPYNVVSPWAVKILSLKGEKMNINKKIGVILFLAMLAVMPSTAYAQSISLRMPGAHWRADYGPGGTRVQGEVGSGDYRLRYDNYRPYDRYGYGYGNQFGGPVGGYYPPSMGIGSYGPPLGFPGTVVFRPDITAIPSPQGDYTVKAVNNLPISIKIDAFDPIYRQDRGGAFISNNHANSFSLRGPCVLQARDELANAPIGQAVLVDRPGVLIVEGGGLTPPMGYNPSPNYGGGSMGTYFSSPPPAALGGQSASLMIALEDFRNAVRRGTVPSPAQAERLLRELLVSGIDLLKDLAGL